VCEKLSVEPGQAVEWSPDASTSVAVEFDHGHVRSHHLPLLLMHALCVQAGPSKNMNWFNANGNGSTTPAGRRGTDADAMNGNAVMFDAGKILTVGGSPSYVNSVATAHANLVSVLSAGELIGCPLLSGEIAGSHLCANIIMY